MGTRCLTVLLLFFTIQVLDAKDKIFRAGAAQIELTPPIGTKIYGNWVQPSAVNIHDPLYAKALVLNDGTTIIALVVADLVEINEHITDLAKDLVFQETGLRKEYISILATHTHSGPGVQGDGYVPDVESLKEYSRYVARKLADSIISASVNSPYGHCEIVRTNTGYENLDLLKAFRLYCL